MSAVRPAALFFICVATTIVGNCFAQQKQIHEPEFGEGTLEEVAEEMGGLLRLEWKDKNIALKRDWDKRKKKVEKDEELEDAIEKLIERGVDERRLKQLAARDLGNIFGEERPGVEEAFFAIQSKLGGGGGSSRIGSGRPNSRYSFTARGLSGSAYLGNFDTRFTFEESKALERKFEFRDNGIGRLYFTFSCDQLFIRFIQNEKGNTQLIWVEGDKVNAYVGRTFSDFVNDNPQAANKVLFPLLQQLGIRMPMDKTDPHVLKSALTRLEMQSSDEEEVQQLIKDLGSGSYEKRKTASERLTEGFDRWSAQIEKSLQDESLTFETKARLKGIASENPKSETDILLTDQKLLESPEFLISLFDVATDDQKTFVAEQLKKVTGQNLGTDLDAWKKWLSTSETK